MEKEKLQTCGLFYTFFKNASFLRAIWRLLVSESISLLPQLCYVWSPEKQEPKQNSAHKQFIRGSACGKVGEQGRARPVREGVQEGWLTVCWQPHSPFGGLPCVSLLRAACDAWDLGESSRCFWSPALVLGQLALFSWPSLLLEHCPKCPLQGRLEEGLDWQPGLSVQAICNLSYAREPSFVWTKAVMTAGSGIAKSCTFE